MDTDAQQSVIPAYQPVIPAQAGIQGARTRLAQSLGPRLRGDDVLLRKRPVLGALRGNNQRLSYAREESSRRRLYTYRSSSAGNQSEAGAAGA